MSLGGVATKKFVMYVDLKYKGDSSPMFFPKIFILFPKMIPTSPHADTGHECSDGFLSHSTSSYLVQLKPPGNSSGLLWYLILTISYPPQYLQHAYSRFHSSDHNCLQSHDDHLVDTVLLILDIIFKWANIFSTQNLINTGTHPFYIFLTF